MHLPFPCTMLAGCGRVCILKTAHKSTCELGSWPSEGSRHKTRRSLQRIPINGRGVNSGARQSTCTDVESPWELIESNETTAFRTTRVNRRGPSMMRRLKTNYRTINVVVRQVRLKNLPMRLNQWTGKSTSDPWLPLNQFSSRLRLPFAFIHVVSERWYLYQCSVEGIVHKFIRRRGIS